MVITVFRMSSLWAILPGMDDYGVTQTADQTAHVLWEREDPTVRTILVPGQGSGLSIPPCLLPDLDDDPA